MRVLEKVLSIRLLKSMFEHTLQTAFSFSFSLCLSFKSRFDNKTQNQKEKEKQNEFYENSYRVEFLLVVDF